MAEDSNILSARLAGHLRGCLPSIGAADVLAGKIGVCTRTARAYLDGHWPGARQWRAIVREFGRSAVDAVFSPEIDDVTARLTAEIRELEGRLHARRAALQSMAGGQASVAEAEDAG